MHEYIIKMNRCSKPSAVYSTIDYSKLHKTASAALAKFHIVIVSHFCISTPVLDKNCNIYIPEGDGKNNIVAVNNGIDTGCVPILGWYSSERGCHHLLQETGAHQTLLDSLLLHVPISHSLQ